MKKILSILLSIILIISICPLGVFEFMASATTYSGSCGTNATWEYNTEISTLTISGTGAMYDYSYSSYNGDNVTTAPWRSYYQDIKTVVIETGVTSIGSSAFEACFGLTSVTISNSVISIGTRAFLWCTGLKSIAIPDSVTSISLYAFYNCSGIESIVVESGNPIYHSAGNCIIETESKTLVAGFSISKIPADGSVTSIGNSSFEGCSNLTSITIPNSITSIGDYAFFTCTALAHVWYQGSEYEKSNNLTVNSLGNDALKNARWHYYIEGTQEFLSDFAGGSGTADDPYLISTEDHLDNVRYYMSSYFKMVNDIEISGFLPIGGDAYYHKTDDFSGYFDGNGFSISGRLCGIRSQGIYGSGSHYVGLFFSVTGTVCNLQLKNYQISVSDSNAYAKWYAGGIAAYNYGSIMNCSVNGLIYVFHDGGSGGIASYNYGTIESCVNFATVARNNYVAGIAYYNAGGIINCYNAGTIETVTSNSQYGNYHAAGIAVDYGGDGMIESCYNVGKIIGASSSGIGARQTKSYYLSGSCSSNYNGAQLSDYNMKKKSSFVGFDFENVWTMEGDPDYPYPELRCFALSEVMTASGTCEDSLIWEYNVFTNALTISGTGDMNNFLYPEYSPWYSYRNSIETVEFRDGVTSIGDYAFYNYTGLTNITIPDSVTSIGYEAFSRCNNLKTVYYGGTESQRNQISIGSYNTELTNAKWIYNCSAEHAEVLQKIEAKGDTLRSVYMKTAIQKKSGAKPSDDEYNLRLISMIDCLVDYSEVGFYITIAGYNDGENDEPIRYSTDTVYTSFLNGGTRVKASDYGAEYFTIVNMTVPNEYYSANIKIKPYIVFTDGSEFSGNEINTTVSKYIK